MNLVVRAGVLAIIMVFAVISPAIAQDNKPNVSADAAVLLDSATGQVLFAKNENKRMYPASLTKIMTVLIALESGCDQDEVITVSRKAASWNAGSILGLQVNDKLTFENLLKSAMLVSANDSTIAIAEHTAGEYDTFVNWMNLKAQLLGARKTRFVNTHGWSHPNHYTTALDLARITRYALTNKEFVRLCSTREAVITWQDSDRKCKAWNTNRLLHSDYQGVDGVKTGTTAMAGDCLIASATRQGRQLIAVVLHSDNRYQDARKLLDYGFKSIRPVTACREQEIIALVPVNGGLNSHATLVAGKTLNVWLPYEQQDQLVREVRIDNEIQAPVRCGQKLGDIIFTVNGTRVGKIPLIAGGEVPKSPWYHLFKL
ncbi:MAG: D-alanyl-D-alanine carboxypeptidase [Peptococcaceae bacterium]|nr:D-alanyl-D-alanine carboxypeptidase [Peptococcaceae bacterium]